MTSMNRCIYCNSPFLIYGERSEVEKVNYMVSRRHYEVICDECKRIHIRTKVWWAEDEPALKDCTFLDTSEVP